MSRPWTADRGDGTTANPRPGWTVEHAGDGLRLACVRTAYAHDLRALPNP
ncbi:MULTISPECIES: hypothetical protein [unclassified Streptomyces]|nr:MULTISPECIES: hypothetical protein [unclassified Streptomyces]WSP60376.1 hypothetical protein OG306_08470 [Streptomyces sp. NBC_01241]WSU26759.1 hypothetical protein OG508_30875 [Streptomyces sp. NBC_01108]MCX4785937.1 hypothetical protein [Streptomyces sp. NBC_01221]MCX4798207.1 hypothetical protein [Streptomyces sp. NBC_01242]WSJ41351.1 hypothetical protein OG772_27885 [Streptomyces sp. NBC_01321]